jgi:hypothetical protein
LHGAPLTQLQGLRELLHDAPEGLLGFDPISLVKPHLGLSFRQLDVRLQAAVFSRYVLPDWSEVDYAAHKRADRLAAASEALLVAGWSREEIRHTLLIDEWPVTDDPVPVAEDLQPWQPWPPQLAASVFLAKLCELSAPGPSTRPPGDLTAIIDREALLRRLASVFSRLSDRARRGCSAPPTGSGVHDTFVSAEAGDHSQCADGVIAGGERDETGAWILEEPFTIFTTDEELLVCQGYNCHVEIQ